MMIKEWRRAWRLYSVQLAAALVVLDVAGGYLPQITDIIGHDYARYLGAGIIVARIIRQASIATASGGTDGGGTDGLARPHVARSARVEDAGTGVEIDAGGRA